MDANGLIEAGVTLLAATAAALIVRRLLDHPGALGSGRVDPVLATRFQVIRRLVVASILAVGVFMAISQVNALDRLATSLLASSAIVAATVGFASRQVLGNAIAGIQLAVAQPVRIGDTITVNEQTGVVEDVRLTSTYIRTAANVRIIVPNEQMIGATVRNDTIISPEVASEVALWLPADADVAHAIEVLAADAATADHLPAIRVAEMSPEGAVRLVITGPTTLAAERLATEGALRATCLARLRNAGLLPTGAGNGAGVRRREPNPVAE